MFAVCCGWGTTFRCPPPVGNDKNKKGTWSPSDGLELQARERNVSSKNLFLAGAILIACAGALDAQTYLDRQGTPVQSTASIPYDYWPVGSGQHNLAPTVATALTVPASARFMRVCATTATVKYTTDGLTTPTASIGEPLFASSCLELSGVRVLSNFRAISATGTLDVEYFQ